MPSGPVFEGMRAVVTEGRFDAGLLAIAVALLVAWMAIAGTAFALLFHSARDRGLLLQSGE
jgi:ABC-2 type transport system permease protein